MGWIVAGIIVAGFALLGLAFVPILNRMPELTRAFRRLNSRAGQAQQLAESAARLSETVAQLERAVADRSGGAEFTAPSPPRR